MRKVESFLNSRGGEASSADVRHYFCDKPEKSEASLPKKRLDELRENCAYPWLLKEVLSPMVKRNIFYIMPRLCKKNTEKWYILTKETKLYMKLAEAWAKMEETITCLPAFEGVNPGILAYSHLTRAWQIGAAQERAYESPETEKIWRALEEDGGYVDNVYEKLPKGAELIASTETEEERKQRETFYKETGGVFTVDFPPSLEDNIARAAAFEKTCLIGVAAAKQVREELEIQLKKRKNKELESSN